MKTFALLMLFALIAASQANIFEGIFSDPEHPGKCVRDGIVLAPGEELSPEGKCERFICRKEDGFGTLLSCDNQVITPGCRLGDQLEPKGLLPYCCVWKEICD